VQLAARGIAVMMISSELPEVLAVSDRIVTMRRGRITGEMPGVEANEEKLMELMALDKQDALGQDALVQDAEDQAR
jgi:inositol transport system ATP-binding protein